MGRCLAERSMLRGMQTILLNRGNTYWGCAVAGISSEPGGGGVSGGGGGTQAVGPSASMWLWQHLDWNDKASIRQAARFVAAIDGEVVIVDFSCDTAKQMALFLRVLREAGARESAAKSPSDLTVGSGVFHPRRSIVSHYVLISSDSVYQGQRLASVAEDQPTFASMAAGASRSDRRSYAYQKALIEAALIEGAPNGCAVTVLRLPDVIGPRDPTGRFWATLLWARSQQPLVFPAAAAVGGQVLSIVFSEDVVTWLLAVLAQGPAWAGGVYNLACSERPTLLEFTWMVADAMDGAGSATLVPCADPDADTCDYYPSVTCGPLSLAKAVAASPAWQPTPLRDAVAASAAFFAAVDVVHAWPEYAKALRKLPAHVRAAMA